MGAEDLAAALLRMGGANVNGTRYDV